MNYEMNNWSASELSFSEDQSSSRVELWGLPVVTLLGCRNNKYIPYASKTYFA